MLNIKAIAIHSFSDHSTKLLYLNKICGRDQKNRFQFQLQLQFRLHDYCELHFNLTLETFNIDISKCFMKVTCFDYATNFLIAWKIDNENQI